MTTPPPDHGTRPDFGISVRGYDRAQVDAYFGRVVEWLADAENRAMAAERAREVLASEVTHLRATVTMLEERAGLPAPQSMSTFNERMAKVMESALQAAQELRSEAEQEARQRHEAATDEADRLVAAAREEAEQLVADAGRVQREMEASIDALRASRAEAVETLVDLQRRIATVVGEPEPVAGADGDSARAGGYVDDDTTVLPAVVDASNDDTEDGATEVDPSTDGVLVTAAPTIVQPAVGTSGDRRASPGSRRRSA